MRMCECDQIGPQPKRGQWRNYVMRGWLTACTVLSPDTGPHPQLLAASLFQHGAVVVTRTHTTTSGHTVQADKSSKVDMAHELVQRVGYANLQKSWTCGKKRLHVFNFAIL